MAKKQKGERAGNKSSQESRGGPVGGLAKGRGRGRWRYASEEAEIRDGAEKARPKREGESDAEYEAALEPIIAKIKARLAIIKRERLSAGGEVAVTPPKPKMDESKARQPILGSRPRISSSRPKLPR